MTAMLYGGTLEGRLAALRALCKIAEPRPRRGTNLHIHTNESFSVFRSPTEAVWQAVREGLAVFGINDHYTTAGHDEFRRACEVARLPATFSMEAVAMDRDAEANGELTNDPGNPGRTYLCAKGITRLPPDGSPAAQGLATMRAALERRNREMTQKVQPLFRERLGADGPTWDDVAALTPRGNVTERHIAQATAIRLRELAGDHPDRTAELAATLTGAELPGTCTGSPPAGCRGHVPEALPQGGIGTCPRTSADMQNFIRAKLLKAGGPCFVDEAPDAFLPLEEMRDLFLAFGAIPTYPVLANPVTGGERDLRALMDRLEDLRIYALEVIPHRNTRERLAEVLDAARERSWPVFSGTEHNTPERAPLLAPLALDPEFLPWFDSSASVLLGHHALVARGEPGFVGDDGVPTIPDAADRLAHFGCAGQRVRERLASDA